MNWTDIDFMSISEELMDLAVVTTDKFFDAQIEIEEETLKSEPSN